MPEYTQPDVIELTQRLIRCDTETASQGERPTLELLADLLRGAGFSCFFDAYDANRPDRVSLLARLRAGASSPSLLFGGHIDTVPRGNAPWAGNHLSADIRDGWLFGRGSSDMKSGVAAMVCAALRMAPRLKDQDLVLHIYGGEEVGCLGSFHAAQDLACFGSPGAVVIAEPTSNRPLAGHKGALWLKLRTTGRTAHAALPEYGDNALAKLLPPACRLLETSPRAEHPWLGKGTMVLSTLHAGLNTNSVPDLAELTVDLRTVPSQNHQALRQEIAGIAGQEVETLVMLDVPPVWTDPEHPWCVATRRLLASYLGQEPGVETAGYFTDAAAVRAVLPEVPIMILGPGEAAMAHRTDESCSVEAIRTAQSIYESLIEKWYRLS